MKLQWIILFSIAALLLYLYTYSVLDVDLFPFMLPDALTLIHKTFVSMFDSFLFSFCFFVRNRMKWNESDRRGEDWIESSPGSDSSEILLGSTAAHHQST